MWGQTFSILMHLVRLIYGREPEYEIKPATAGDSTIHDAAKL